MPLYEDILRPWLDVVVDETGPLELFDVHTHIGANDPDGFRQSTKELLAELDAVNARSVVFPMHEPDGYPSANDAVIAAAADSGGRLTPFCRVNPHLDPATEARRAVDAGARGIKLHPRADDFTLAEPGVRETFEVAAELGVPVLTHAGRGIPALGIDAVGLAGDFPGVPLILAHAAVSDLGWIWQEMPDHPNLLIDTSWWGPADLISLFSLVPSSQILFASDSPTSSRCHRLRCNFDARSRRGVSPDAIRKIAGPNLETVLSGSLPASIDPPAGSPPPLDPLLERVVAYLTFGLGRAFDHGDITEPIALTRVACDVGEGSLAPVCRTVGGLLDTVEEHWGEPPAHRPFPDAVRLLVAALIVARTPDVPLPG